MKLEKEERRKGIEIFIYEFLGIVVATFVSVNYTVFDHRTLTLFRFTLMKAFALLLKP